VGEAAALRARFAGFFAAPDGADSASAEGFFPGFLAAMRGGILGVRSHCGQESRDARRRDREADPRLAACLEYPLFVNAAGALRPRTCGEILDSSFTFYRRRFWTLLAVSTVFALPALAGSLLLAGGVEAAVSGTVDRFGEYMHEVNRAHGRWDQGVFDSYLRVLESATTLNWYMYASALAQAVARGGICVACALAVARVVRGEPSVGALRLVRESIPLLAGATAVWLMVPLVSMFCGICPPFMLFVQAVLAPGCAVLALERPDLAARGGFFSRVVRNTFVAPIVAVGRCFGLSMHGMTLVRGSFVVAAILMFVGVVVGVLSLAAGLLAESVGIGFVANQYAEVLFLPVVGTCCALWYMDLIVRREGADLR